MATIATKTLEEVMDIKAILAGDGTTESMKKSIQYRLEKVEEKVSANGESLWNRFKKIPMGRKITIFIIGIPFIGSYWDQFFDMIQGILDFVQAIPK